MCVYGKKWGNYAFNFKLYGIFTKKISQHLYFSPIDTPFTNFYRPAWQSVICCCILTDWSRRLWDTHDICGGILIDWSITQIVRYTRHLHVVVFLQIDIADCEIRTSAVMVFLHIDRADCEIRASAVMVFLHIDRADCEIRTSAVKWYSLNGSLWATEHTNCWSAMLLARGSLTASCHHVSRHLRTKNTNTFIGCLCLISMGKRDDIWVGKCPIFLHMFLKMSNAIIFFVCLSSNDWTVWREGVWRIRIVLIRIRIQGNDTDSTDPDPPHWLADLALALVCGFSSCWQI